MKQVLATIDDTETNIIKDLKGEAFDLLRSISKINEAATAMKDTVNNGAQDDAKFKNDIEALKVEANKLGIDYFVSSLDMFVNIQPGSMALAFEKITDAIFLHTPVLIQNSFSLNCQKDCLLFKHQTTTPSLLISKYSQLPRASSSTPWSCRS